MYKLLIDSDSLIKLAKIGLLENITKTFSVEITEEIYNETVVEGRRRLYEDSNIIKGLVDVKKIKIIKKADTKSKMPIKENFGAGELSILISKKSNHIIVTDGMKFTRYLQSSRINSISSGNIIVALKEKSILTKQQAKDYLEMLKPYIRNDVYGSINKDIEGE